MIGTKLGRPFPWICVAALSLADDRLIDLNLTEDMVIEDSFELIGTPDQRRTISGNGHQIRTKEKWAGTLKLAYCDIRGLGKPAVHALDPRTVQVGLRIEF